MLQQYTGRMNSDLFPVQYGAMNSIADGVYGGDTVEWQDLGPFWVLL